ncbi:putative gmp synthase [Diplogelasinospora grovesii]|uniref:Gmp synthase n=1 Tax=Diplogelasinospora grovesii TaxID=303347 RepID=A0AAN6NAP0_9PEZI|nr:putative gmp synthase [Diplogelasinospora grovesii]
MGSFPLQNRPLRLAILETDTPLPGIVAKYKGGYGTIFTDMFRRAVAPSPLESVLTISTHHIVPDNPSSETSWRSEYPPLDEIDGILITGSRYNAFDNDEWITTLVEYTRKALSTTITTAVDGDIKKGVRVIGVCYGHQIVGRTLGVPVGRTDHGGWEVSVTETKLTPAGKQLFGKDTLKMQQMHRDQVKGLPAGAELLAETDTCPNQGFIIPGRAITVQGHPEFTAEIIKEILETRHDAGVITDDIYRSGIDRMADEHDGVLLARAFLDFLQQ